MAAIIALPHHLRRYGLINGVGKENCRDMRNKIFYHVLRPFNYFHRDLRRIKPLLQLAKLNEPIV